MEPNNHKIRVALAGNANVGKSAIFNYLTGLHQHIGNWPGKTIDRALGSVYFGGYEIEIIDLPGIYSLSTYSLEEIISREYIITEKPDVIINVVDGSVLERNLFFTLQLMELAMPMILAVNQIDVARSKGITVDYEALEAMLGIPVKPTIATKGIGISEVLECIVEIFENQQFALPIPIQYGEELEKQLMRLQKVLKTKNVAPQYPQRWLALKLLEQDEKILNIVKATHPEAIILAESIIKALEELHDHSCRSLIASEKYHTAASIIYQVQKIQDQISPDLREKIDGVLLHPVLGYFLLFAIVFGSLYAIFTIGDVLSASMLDMFDNLRPSYENLLGKGKFSELMWAGLEGLIGGITIALPYILPFYLLLAILEDSGYMTRVAFLMDRLMHSIGLHGKAFIPCMLGIGCNVPGCLSCRIMERQRDRLLTAFIVTLIPCAAQTIIILALVGKYVGFEWVIAIYLFDLIIILLLGRIAFKTLPGEPMGLILEMVTLHRPNMKVVLIQTWFRLREFIYIAIPLIVIGNVFLKLLELLGLQEPINKMLIPITAYWLGLPEETGIALIFGIARKELAVILLGTLFNTTDLGSVMTPSQMIVFSVVSMFYIPCIATIAALKKEFQWKKTLMIGAFEILFAILIGGIIHRLLLLFSGNLGL